MTALGSELRALGVPAALRRELVLAADGFKPARLMLTEPGLAHLTPLGLAWRAAGPSMICEEDPTLGGYSNWMRLAGPGESGRRVVFIGRSQSLVDELAASWEDPVAVGRGLRIPACCTRFYLAEAGRTDRGEYSHLWSTAERDRLEVWENPLGRYFNAGFFDHFVCRPGCPATEEEARTTARRLVELDPILADELVLPGTFLYGRGRGVHRLEAVSLADWAPCVVRASTCALDLLGREIRRRDGVIELLSAHGHITHPALEAVTATDSLPTAATGELTGTRVGIVGATGHVGKILAGALVSAGARVEVLSRSMAAARALCSRLEATPRSLPDIGDPDVLVLAHHPPTDLAASTLRLARAYFTTRPDGVLVIPGTPEGHPHAAYAATKREQAAVARSLAEDPRRRIIHLVFPALRRWSLGAGRAPEPVGASLIQVLTKGGRGWTSIEL